VSSPWIGAKGFCSARYCADPRFIAVELTGHAFARAARPAIDNYDQGHTSTRMNQRPQFPGDFPNRLFPLARVRLPKEPECRIPWTVTSIEQPAPVGNLLQHHPRAQTQRPSQLRGDGIDADDQSICRITAAVSARFSIGLAALMMSKSTWLICSLPPPTCKLKSWTIRLGGTILAIRPRKRLRDSPNTTAPSPARIEASAFHGQGNSRMMKPQT
jgi:hypothetical protein